MRSSSAPPPRARHHVDPEREVELLEYLDLAGMLEFALDADIHARLVSGMLPLETRILVTLFSAFICPLGVSQES